YSPGLTEAELKLSIGQLMLQRLGGHAEYADRITIGPIELIVREVDDNGKIATVGLSFEPTPQITSIPAFLSPAELADRISALIADWRRRRRGEPVPEPTSEQIDEQDSYNSRGN